MKIIETKLKDATMGKHKKVNAEVEVIEPSTDLIVNASLEEVVEYDDDMETYVNLVVDAAQIAMLTNMIAGNYLVKKFFDRFKIAGNQDQFVRAGVMRKQDVEAAESLMASRSAQITVKPGKKNTSVFYPTIFDFKVLSFGSVYNSSPWFPTYQIGFGDGGASKADQLINAIEELFGKDIWNIDKAVRIAVPVTPDMLSQMPGVSWEDIDKDQDLVDNLMQQIKTVYIVSPAATAVKGTRKLRSLKDAEKGADMVNVKSDLWNARSFQLFAEIQYPNSYVKYATQNVNPTVVDMHMYFASAWKASNLYEEVPDQFMHPRVIAEQTKNNTRWKRTNEDGLSIDREGIPIWVPTKDTLATFDKKYREAGYEDAEMGWSLDHFAVPRMTAADDPISKINNMIVYNDEVNSKLSYTHDGLIDVMDLEETVPLMPIHVKSFWDSPLIENKSSGSVAMGIMNFYGSRNADLIDAIKIDLNDFKALIDKSSGGRLDTLFGYAWSGNVDDEMAINAVRTALRTPERYINDVTNAISYIENITRVRQEQAEDRGDEYEAGADQEWINTAAGDVTKISWKHLTPNSENPMLRPLGAFLDALTAKMVKTKDEQLKTRAIGPAMRAIGIAQLYQTYMKDQAKVEKEVAEYNKTIKVSKPKQDWVDPGLPNVQPNFSFLPHQGGVQQKIAGNPVLTAYAVDAGGGKTLLALTRAIRNIHNGSATRPLIVCPPYLIENYVKDAITLTQGKMNIICITRSTVNRHGAENIANMVKNAPPNTICISDYYYIKGGTYTVPYGNTSIVQCENSQFLREMGFDEVYADESHFLKNYDSQITQAATKLMNVIPRRSIMSGTMVDGSASDLAPQNNLLDPTLFGSQSAFLEKYAASHNGRKVTVWKEGAERMIRERIESRVSFIQVKKKEWSALLPNQVENFWPAELTDAQRKVYEAILEETLDAIRNDASLMSKLKKGGDDDEGDAEVDLEGMLNPYLARLEQFLTAPGTDEMGEKLLTGDDLISPKLLTIYHVLEDHIKRGIKGKVLVFTSYNRSAEEIFNRMPAKLKKVAMLYKASTKDRDMARFEKDDSVQILVGVEQSLNTGRNLQYVSRIIRVESVWNPGTLEQAESRIFRPDLKNLDKMGEKYLDWVIASGTIDVTKAARLMSKIMSKVKFEEQHNPLYANLPTLPLIPMNLDTIASSNHFEKDLRDHLNAYKRYKDTIKKDFEQYRNDPTTLKNNFPVKQLPNIPGSKYLVNAPYIENMSLPFETEMGIMNLGVYAAERNMGVNELDANGMLVHTEYGDGEVIKSTGATVHVRVKKGGKRVIVEKSKAFAFLDQDAAKKRKVEIKEELSKKLGIPSVTVAEIDTEAEEEEEVVTKPTKPERSRGAREQEEEAPKKRSSANKPGNDEKPADERPVKPIPNVDFKKNSEVEAFAFTINDQIVIGLDGEDPDVAANEKALKAMGFEPSGRYAYAHIRSKAAFNALYDFIKLNLKKGNISLHDELLENLEMAHEAFQQSKKMATFIDMIDSREFKDMRMMRKVRSRDPKAVLLTFIVEDGEFFAIINLDKAIRGNTLIKKTVKGIKWEINEGDWQIYFRKKSEAVAFLNELASRITISNLDEVKDDLKAIKIRKRKGDEPK